jgi:hypothetical protein
LGRGESNYTKEAQRFQNKALAGDTRFVRLGPILFFCTNQDAWMLDVEDRLARCLVDAGQKLPLGVHETRQQFAVEWTARYKISGEVFTVLEIEGRGRSMLGYPTRKILELSQGH